MYRMPFVLAAMLVLGTATGYGQGSRDGTTAVTFQSSTYTDMRQLLAREAPATAVTIKANLGFPEEIKERYPAIIVVHSISGYRDSNEGYIAGELRKAGFATLTYDTFAARRTTGTVLQKSPAICRLAWRTHLQRCDGLRTNPGSTPVELPSSASPMAAKSRI